MASYRIKRYSFFGKPAMLRFAEDSGIKETDLDRKVYKKLGLNKK